MVTASVMSGSGRAGEMVFTEAVLLMLNLIRSAPGVLLASWMAALKVHWLPLVRDTSHTLLFMFLSPASPVRLTVKVAASAGPENRARSTPAKASAASARSAFDRGLLALDSAPLI